MERIYQEGKPLLKIIKEDYKKEIQESILLKGLKDLIESNTKRMTSLNTTNMTTLMNEFEKKIVYPASLE